MIDFEEFFKDKIDWKDYNYILDKVTSYEDEGYHVAIFICVAPSTLYYMNIFKYSSKDKDNGYYKLTDFPSLDREQIWSNVMSGYKKYGIYFRIYAFDDQEYLNTEFPNKVYKSISDRLDRCPEFEGDDGDLIVRSIS